MKLNEKELDEIIDDASQYIYDDLWNEFSIEWIEDYLNGNTKNEYDNEDLNEILKRLQNVQKEAQEEEISEEKKFMYRAIEEFIDDDNNHLSLTDIGKILVKLANNYLNV